MGIRSEFLFHWTGKDIEENGKECEHLKKKQEYVKRLKDCYENGLYLKRTDEDTLRKMKIKHLLRMCFTEIKLSQAGEHAKQYGQLGIGFTRDFIIQKGGRPVIYIPHNKGDYSLLEDSLYNAYEKSKNCEEVHRSLKWVYCYVKRMGDGCDPNKFYGEMEWRVVGDDSSKDAKGKPFTRGAEKGTWRLAFKPLDVKVIIFPDEETKLMSLEDEAIKGFFSEHKPEMRTVDMLED